MEPTFSYILSKTQSETHSHEKLLVRPKSYLQKVLYYFLAISRTHTNRGLKSETPKGRARIDSHLHHTSRENAHNTSSYVRVRAVNRSSVTVPVGALLLVGAGTAQWLQFVFLAEGGRRGCRIVGSDNDVDDIG